MGSYIAKLMTVVVDEKQEEFVVNLAIQELVKIRNDINSFLQKNDIDNSEKVQKNKKAPAAVQQRGLFCVTLP